MIGLTAGGCFDASKTGRDLAAGALSEIEKTIDEKLQANADNLEDYVDEKNGALVADLSGRGLSPEAVAAIASVITGLGGLGANFLRNRKYRELPWWKKIFTGGARS